MRIVNRIPMRDWNVGDYYKGFLLFVELIEYLWGIEMKL